MLRCSCQIVRPFTLAFNTKNYVFQCNSVYKIPSGCSCCHRKSIFMLVGRHNKFSKRDWDLKKSLLKEQKYLRTSFLFFKDKDIKQDKINKNGSEAKSLKSQNRTKDESSDGNKNQDDSTKVKTATQIFGSIDTVEKTQLSTVIDKNETTETKVSEQTSEIDPKLLFSAKPQVSASSTQGVPGIESKVLVKLPESDSTQPTESSKLSKVDPKRQAYELNLGDFAKETSLVEPPGLCQDDSCRAPDEIKAPKDSTPLLEKAKNILRKTTSTLKADENNRIVKVINLGAPKGDINIGTTTRRRQTVDLNRSSTERNFITPVRAMTDFLLKPSDLEGLRKTKRRSPYENDPPITVYWRKDVEAKALDVWGSKENLLKEILKRDIERRRYQQNLFTVKRRLRDYRREQGRESEFKLEQNGLFGSSGKVVLTAIAINGTNFMFKLLAWFYTGSHSMFSEAVHSLADTINQLILAYGIHKSIQRADSDHPYGYTNMRYVASLISGVGIFCVGSGLSFYHGFVGLTDPSDLPSFYWAYFILGGSLASEGATLLVAFNSIRIGARVSEMSFSEYVLRGQDPSVNVVLLEDMAAVIGVICAGCCMGLSSYYGSHIPDAIGSFLVGGLLAGVASFIIYTNVAALVGRSIPQERLDKINAELESDVMIRAIHDVKGIDIGNSLVRYKAEMDFDGGELTRSYLDKQDLNQMLEEVKKMQTIDELEEFMLKHGENIVDMMGGEIDRIELKLRKKHPEIRHCDLEIL